MVHQRDAVDDRGNLIEPSRETLDSFLDRWLRDVAAVKVRAWILQGRLAEALDWVREQNSVSTAQLEAHPEYEALFGSLSNLSDSTHFPAAAGPVADPAALAAWQKHGDSDERLRTWTDRLVRWCEAVFLNAYFNIASEGDFILPRGIRRPFLWAYLFDKALYEIRYELGHRPDWTWLPLHGLRRLLLDLLRLRQLGALLLLGLRREVAIFTRPDTPVTEGIVADLPWACHARGVLVADVTGVGATVADWRSAQAWPPAGAEPVDVGATYDRLAEAGFDHGPAFERALAAWRRGDETFVEVSLDEALLLAGEASGDPDTIASTTRLAEAIRNGQPLERMRQIAALFAGVDFPRLLLDAFFGRPEACASFRQGVASRWTFPREVEYVRSCMKDESLPVWRRIWPIAEFFLLGLDPRVRSDLLYPGDRVLYMRMLRQSVAKFLS